uniref:Uncharacterized protein n=1 Tax=Meloidogyne enterolobii TaxID=390850 RepID=A0A6V7U9L8_MELEN|nr:unnamed protein product [Meloidogyne enterolobii]
MSNSQKASLFISTGFLISTAKFLIKGLGSSNNGLFTEFTNKSSIIWNNSKALLLTKLTNENVGT